MWVTEDGIRYNNENPVVCDEYWDNSEYYGNVTRVPAGYHELGWRIYLDTLTREQKDTFHKRLKIAADNCKCNVWVKRHKDCVVVDGVVSNDEEDILGKICDEYETFGLKTQEVWW